MSPHATSAVLRSSPQAFDTPCGACTWLLIGSLFDEIPVFEQAVPAHIVWVLDASSHLPDPPANVCHVWPVELWHAVCTDAIQNGFAHGTWGDKTLTIAIAPQSQDRASTLAALHCEVDQLWIASSWLDVSTAAATTLARRCRREAQLHLPPHTHTDAICRNAWQKAGFVFESPSTQPPVLGHYRPRWPLSTRPLLRRQAIVIGAGLAGAAVCHSLIQRGWYVVLIDQASGPAQGASGLPVGMMSEHRTARPTPMSQLSRLGLALHRRRLRQDIPIGAGWQPTAITNLRGHSTDEGEGEGESAFESVDPSSSAQTDTDAALVRPSALVAAWLALAQASGRCTMLWNAPVHTLEPIGSVTNPCWQVLGPDERLWAHAPHVIVTAAFGSSNLLAPHAQYVSAGQTLRSVKGQLSYGRLEGAALAPHPLRDHGVFVPCYEDRHHPLGFERMWTMGSTYERGHTDPSLTQQAHDRNAQSLQAMHPAAYNYMQAQQAQGQLHGWAGIRCASLDRLPLVGAVPAIASLKPSLRLHEVPRVAGLWTICAMGSRGLTLAELAGEFLVAQLEGEPWPLPRALGEALDPARFALKAARQIKIPTK